MTEQLTNQELTTEEVDTNSREYWKQEAAKLGLSYPQNLKTESLIELVQVAIKNKEEMKKNQPKRGMSSNMGTLAPEVQAMQDAALSLVRFRLHVLDPSKQSATGIFVSAGNDNIAPIKRMIPFNVNVWHAERIIVEHLKNMKFTRLKSKYVEKLKGSFDDPESRTLMPCFSIEELPPLTTEELQNLSKLQAQQGTGQTMVNS